MSKPRIVVIAGPTAAGKSALALELARRARAEILVADSRQVYRGMDIGTAKADAETRADVRHHGIDVVESGEQFDASKFRALALDVMEEARRRGTQIVVEGGTGLYLRALVRGLMDAPSRDEDLRVVIRGDAERLGWPALHERLAKVDPEYAASIATTDPVRITRALEVHALTGKPFSAFAKEHALREAELDVMGLFVDVEKDEHRGRIRARVEKMWKAGLVEETNALIAKVGEGHPLVGTINYAQAAAHLRGELSEDEAKEDAVVKTAQFAKRQRTWFRKEEWLKRAEGAGVVEDAVAWMGAE